MERFIKVLFAVVLAAVCAVTLVLCVVGTVAACKWLIGVIV